MSKQQSEFLMNQVRDILNQWDFLGVVDSGIKDEYDCLVGPVTQLLSEGQSRSTIESYIKNELNEHFGLARHYSQDNLNSTIDKLLRLRVKSVYIFRI